MEKSIYRQLDEMKVEFEDEHKNFSNHRDLDDVVQLEAENIFSQLYIYNKLIIEKQLTSVYGCMVVLGALKRNGIDVLNIDYIIKQ